MKFPLLVAAVLACVFFGDAHPLIAQRLPFTHYTPDSEVNALPSSEVHNVYQDSDGFIWLTVFSSGMVRYDGHRMVTYGVADGLRDPGVWDVVQDGSGHLWVASNGGLSVSEEPLGAYRSGRRIRFATSLHGTPLIDVAVNYNRMVVDDEGRLWVGTEGVGIVRYQVRENASVAVDTLLASGPEESRLVRALVKRRDGSVWAALSNGRLLAFEPGSRVPMPVPLVADASQVTTNTLYEGADGTLWGGRRNGEVWRLRQSAEEYEMETVSDVMSANVSSMLELRDGTLWVMTENDGILALDPSGSRAPQVLTRDNGLIGNVAFHATYDREGNVWIAQSGGVAKLRYNFADFEYITSQLRVTGEPLLPYPSVHAVALGQGARDPCALWVGTSGGASCVTRGVSDYVQIEDGLRDNWVNGMAYDARGRLWVGTLRGINSVTFEGQGLPNFVTSQQQTTVLGQRAQVAGYRSASILSVSRASVPDDTGDPDRTEVILMPAYQVVYVLANDRWILLNERVGLPLAIMHAAAFDPAGHLWVGTRDHGLYRTTQPVTLAQLRVYERDAPDPPQPTLTFAPIWTVESGAPSNQVEVLRWHRDRMWIGTPEGLAAMDLERNLVLLLTQEDGLQANNAVSFDVSPVTGNLWVGGNGGLAEVDPSRGKVLRTVGKQEGLLDNEVWFYGSVRVGPDGVVYAGTSKGLTVFRSERSASNPLAPPLYLTAFDQSENEAGRNEVSFEYAGLSFANERQVRYRTRLLGFDDDWSEPTTDTRLRYTNLPAVFNAKPYTLQVVASNESGVWTETPLEFTFLVQPRWWLRWWAFGLYGILLAVGVFVVDRVQRRRLISRERLRAREREQALRLENAEALASYLNADNERKTAELESARRLQLSLLPTDLPAHPSVDLGAYMCTATEVGGDYYDWQEDGDTLTLVIGDATGHGATAGTVVTATKGLFLLLAGNRDLREIVRLATRALKKMRFRNMFMALALARVRGREVTFVGAGMPPALVYRAATRSVETVSLKGMPLGGFLNYPYQETTLTLYPDDAVLIMTDGFSELFNEQREMVGDERIETLFADVAHHQPDAIIYCLMEYASQWLGQGSLDGELPTRELGNHDDITMLVLKARP